ncbi:hypothetical protein TG4357_02674 [Thalassovita gelatinovora]|uniref:N-acetyltransferase domain-containing protein n=1 Tax=Thalassovita gelatinovora TaxID=53501 RepID=A0A0P1G4T2_THAGE|nr:hypothetical protein [Thalassovita gelatinovora]QIZ79800.1 hypothetical protein HFZ77_04540 [Thalassovita gelatinovora]CUH66846.1 hypothetical protein TG4357_02674 [Thalassovita gelatinovora]SEQ43804.1 hypothetical protein SAMN04488043_105211 [Thalassovita gelatinovora]
MREENLLKLGGLCLSGLGADGFELCATSDLSGFEAQMRDIGKPDSHPMISTRFHDFASDDVFGLYIKARDGSVVAGMSARMVALGQDNLECHWRRSYARLYNNNGDAPIVSRTSGAREISGRVVYQGELFAHPDWRGGKINVPLVMLYAHALTALKWRPDWIYAFMRIGGISRASEYGFSRQYLGAHMWLQDIERRTEQECLVAVRNDELCELAEFYLRNPGVLPRRKNR